MKCCVQIVSACATGIEANQTVKMSGPQTLRKQSLSLLEHFSLTGDAGLNSQRMPQPGGRPFVLSVRRSWLPKIWAIRSRRCSARLDDRSFHAITLAQLVA